MNFWRIALSAFRRGESLAPAHAGSTTSATMVLLEFIGSAMRTWKSWSASRAYSLSRARTRNTCVSVGAVLGVLVFRPAGGCKLRSWAIVLATGLKFTWDASGSLNVLTLHVRDPHCPDGAETVRSIGERAAAKHATAVRLPNRRKLIPHP